MEIQKRINTATTKLQVYSIYLKLTPENEKKNVKAFMTFLGKSRQTWYNWPAKLPDPVLYEVRARLSELNERN